MTDDALICPLAGPLAGDPLSAPIVGTRYGYNLAYLGLGSIVGAGVAAAIIASSSDESSTYQVECMRE